MTVVVALAGNPNVGKSTIFNALTGSQQHVGNWPGKTVEKKAGKLQLGEQDVVVVDLPGTYSLTAYSIEEIIARDFIVNEYPNMVVVVVDAANLERNLYLVAQIIELKVPVIITLNMTDIADSRGLTIDVDKLSQRLGGIPVVKTVGTRRMGIDELKNAIIQLVNNPSGIGLQVKYDGIVKEQLDILESTISGEESLRQKYNPHWLAIKLLEEDTTVIENLNSKGADLLLDKASLARSNIEKATGEEAEILIADQRYAFIGSVIDKVLIRPRESIITSSDKIDHIVTHRLWGLPIFLLMMWIVFQFTANVSTPYLDWIDFFINDILYGWTLDLLNFFGLGDTWIASLLTDGIIAGVGGVLVFVPVLIFLFLALAVLEDSGYMSRAAFVMDRVMRWMGLHGKSFLPMIVGFGCTVPAVYATRTLENERDRKLTGFLATFMSCGARLPVYVIFGTAFFGTASGNLIFAMYILGIAVALVVGFTAKHTVYKGQPPAPFVMELPPYRLPRVSDVWKQTWARTKGFLVKAGTVIMAVSVVLWLLMAIPAGFGKGTFNNVTAEDSVFGYISKTFSPVLEPAGFGSWEATGSLITGFLAKEVVVGTMSQIYGKQSEDISLNKDNTTFIQELGTAAVSFSTATLQTFQEIVNIVPRTINLIPGINVEGLNIFDKIENEESTTSLQSPLVASFSQTAGSIQAGRIAAVAFVVFVLLYVPCMAAVSSMRHEFGSRWMWIQIIFTLCLAWFAAVSVFQVGTWLFI